MPQQLKVNFCLPGRQFSNNFLLCWTNLLAAVIAKGIKPGIHNSYCCTLPVVRCDCLGGSGRGGRFQKPFGGQDYDYIMWIDSDQVFMPPMFFKLLSHEADIVGGWYPLSEREDDNSIGWIHPLEDTAMPYLTKDILTVGANNQLMGVDYSGFGFMLIKKGVFEKIPYPWFALPEKEHDEHLFIEGDDVNFCRKAREAGFKIQIDPLVRVGHEKSAIF